MKRLAIPALVVLLVFVGKTSAAPHPVDPLTFFVAFSADSGRLVIASHRGGIKVLSIPDLKEIRSIALENDQRLESATVSPSGRWLAGTAKDRPLIWNLETGEAQPPVPVSNRFYLAYLFGPGDDTLFVASDNVRVWDVKQGREVSVLNGLKKVALMTASPDGRYLVALGECMSGRIYGSSCVYSIDEKKILIAMDWHELFRPPVETTDLREYQAQMSRAALSGSWDPVDLLYTSDNRILLTIRGGTEGTMFQSRILNPADMKVLDTTPVEPESGWQYSGFRSAPTPQMEVVSPDKKWKATAYQKRLYLYRITGETHRALETYIPIP